MDFGQSLSHATRFFQVFGLQFFTLGHTSTNKDFSHHGSKVANKFKFSFFLNFGCLWTLVFILFATNNRKGISFESDIVFMVLLCLLGLSTIHSLLTTPKAREIFRKLEEVVNIFERDLKIDFDYKALKKSLKKTFIILLLSIGLINAGLLTLWNFYLPNRSTYLLFFVLFPYFIFSTNISRFIYYIRLVNHGVKMMKIVLDRSNFCPNIETLFERSRDAKIMQIKTAKLDSTTSTNKTLNSLKNIYGILWETTELINDISGPSVLFLLTMTVISNALAGFKIYQFFKKTIPLDHLGGYSNYGRISTLINNICFQSLFT